MQMQKTKKRQNRRIYLEKLKKKKNRNPPTDTR